MQLNVVGGKDDLKINPGTCGKVKEDGFGIGRCGEEVWRYKS